MFAFPAAGLSQDGELFDNPEEFDLYRFVKLSEQDSARDGSAIRWTASQAEATNMAYVQYRSEF